MTRVKKLWMIGLVSAALYGASLRLDDLLLQWGIVDAAPHPVLSYLALIIPLSGLYLWAVRTPAQGGRETGKELFTILFFALLYRAALIPLEPALSSDIYRYLWEGKIQVAAGMNPYVHPPQDEQLASLRDQEIYPLINRKESPTIYPAGAQLLFAGAHWAGIHSPQGLKLLALAADALTVALLLLTLRQLRLPLGRIMIYAWNPLLIYELFYSGHLESFMIPLMVGFIYLMVRGRAVGAGIALGSATAVKLVPLFLLAAVPRGQRLKVALPFAFVMAFAYLFYVNAGTEIFGFLPTYFSDPYEIFNLGFIQLALLGMAKVFALPAAWIRFVLFALLLALLLVAARLPWASPAGVVEKSYIILSAYLLLIYPALHPWYLCALIPILCVIPSRAWILFSALLPLSYLKYLNADGTMPAWVTFLQFVPLYALLAVEFFRLRTLNERGHQWQPLLRTPFSKPL